MKPRNLSLTPRLSITAHPVELGNLLFDRNRTVLSPDEIAGKLNCSRQLVIKLIESGQLGAINIGTGKVKYYRVPAAEWEKFLRNRAAV